MDIISKNEKTAFQYVKMGERREITVTVRLTAERGYLSVFVTPVEENTSNGFGNVFSIGYGKGHGDAADAERKKSSSRSTKQGDLKTFNNQCL